MKKRKLLAYFLVALMIVTSLNGTIHAQNQRASEKVELQNPRTDAEGNTIWDCVYFGNYWQNYANEKEPIKWRVLSVNGNDALLISDRIIEKGAFNETNTDCTWGNSTIRSWLNGYSSENNVDAKDYQDNNFLDEAFSEEEQEAILLSTVVNESNEEYGVIGEADTEDKVYLLSLEENARTE